MDHFHSSSLDPRNRLVCFFRHPRLNTQGYENHGEIPFFLNFTKNSPKLTEIHVLPFFDIRTSVKSIHHKLAKTKAPNAALNDHDGEDIPGYRALTRHHISTPEWLTKNKAAASIMKYHHQWLTFDFWIFEGFICLTWIHPIFLPSQKDSKKSDRNWFFSNLGGSGDIISAKRRQPGTPTFISVITSSCCIVPSWRHQTKFGTRLGIGVTKGWQQTVESFFGHNYFGCTLYIPLPSNNHHQDHHIFRIGDPDRSKAYCIQGQGPHVERHRRLGESQSQVDEFC